MNANTKLQTSLDAKQSTINHLSLEIENDKLRVVTLEQALIEEKNERERMSNIDNKRIQNLLIQKLQNTNEQKVNVNLEQENQEMNENILQLKVL